jgi:hypothetical protein
MAIVIDGTVIGKALSQVLPIIGMDEDPNLVLVNIDELDADKTVEVLQMKKRPMILLAFGHESIASKGLSKLAHTKGVGFIQFPFELVALRQLYDKLLAGEDIENPAVRLVIEAEERRRLIGILLHDMHPRKPQTSIRPAMERAERELGISGSEEEVRAQLEALRNAKTLVGDSARGQLMPGVFCDVEGTLVTASEELNEKVLAQLKEYAKTKPVTLWTGGDLDRVKKLVRSLGVEWPVVSKYDFDGCTVEIAIDDLPKEKFEKDYRISSQKFIQV